MFVGWRLLGTDPDDIAFNVYRSTGGGRAREAERRADHGRDELRRRRRRPRAKPVSYSVRPVRRRPGAGGRRPVHAPGRRPGAALPLDPPPDPPRPHPNDASVGDLDGDGEYEIVLKQEMQGPRQLAGRDDRRDEARSLQARRHASSGGSTSARTSAKGPTTPSSWSTTSTATARPRSSARPPTAPSTARARSIGDADGRPPQRRRATS